MSTEVLALTLTVLVHFVGALVLIAVLMHDSGSDWRSWWPRDDDGRGPETPSDPDAPRPAGGDLPLPGTSPSHVRLREPGRVGEGYPRPPRRPEHPPVPAPERAPERSGS